MSKLFFYTQKETVTGCQHIIGLILLQLLKISGTLEESFKAASPLDCTMLTEEKMPLPLILKMTRMTPQKRLQSRFPFSVLCPVSPGILSFKKGIVSFILQHSITVMNLFKNLGTIILTAFLFTGCTKIIDVDLKNSVPQLVIEGVVTNSDAASVNITQSVQFSNSNNYPAVRGAIVSITDNAGGTFLLQETTPGKYTSSSLIGVEGRTYNLSVSVNGALYQAVSTMPVQVNLDTILLENIAFIPDNIWIIKPQYTDPPGFGDYYKFIEKINGVRNPTIWVWDDKLTNNGISTRPLIQADSTIKIGDTVEIEMQCIDLNNFRYFTALQNLQQAATTPTNPESNISGNVLGYFSAHTSQKRKVAIK